MITASDQGTVVTVDGGKTWSDWYNQPTGQFYHVEADGRFPYWVYSGQQDSGTAGTASRGDYGGLTFREWHPVGADERGWDVPDPADPEIIYGSGLGGSLIRFDNRTGQGTQISPVVETTYARRPTEVKYRYTWIPPVAVSTKKPHALYFASQVLFRSTDRGQSWTEASPDLTGAVPGTPGCDGEVTLANARPCGFGVIYTIALSPHDEDEMWIGTDSGLIHTTKDGGKTWRDVTPKGLLPWSKVASLDVVTPLRQTMPERSGAVGSSPYLFAPAAAVRVRRNVSHDTPLPPETPMGQNPPAGAVIDYVLPRAVAGPVALEILDSAGRVVRSFSRADEPATGAAPPHFA